MYACAWMYVSLNLSQTRMRKSGVCVCVCVCMRGWCHFMIQQEELESLQITPLGFCRKVDRALQAELLLNLNAHGPCRADPREANQA